MGILGSILFNMKNMKKAKKIRMTDISELLGYDDEKFFDAVECVCEDAVYEFNAPELTEEQKIVYTLNKFEAEINNGGLCQFFVNSSRECAPYVSKALDAVGASEIKALFDGFISENNINVNDLSSFIISDIKDFEAQTKRYDFDRFDEKFYEDETLHEKIILYARNNIQQLLK